jgi:hypothetical protein
MVGLSSARSTIGAAGTNASNNGTEGDKTYVPHDKRLLNLYPIWLKSNVMLVVHAAGCEEG